MILISNIQRFCLHDGPGIRTTIFCMGCSIKCPWCANPENLIKKRRVEKFQEKCLQKKEKCIFVDICEEVDNIEKATYLQKKCPANAINIVGCFYSEERLLKEILKDKSYMDFGGGITFSGGEAILQVFQFENVLKKLKTENVDICFESCLFVPEEKLKVALKYANSMIIDIKVLDKNICKKILHGDVELYLKNLATVYSSGIPFIMRLPLIYGITYVDNNLKLISDELKKYKGIKLQIFSVHNLAESKYKKLNVEFVKYQVVPREELEGVKTFFEKNGIATEIITI